MKNLIILALVLVAITTNAQKVKISLKTDPENLISDVIQAHGGKYLFGENNQYSIENISVVLCYEQPSESFIKALTNASVKIIDRYSDPLYQQDYELMPEPLKQDDIMLNMPAYQANNDTEGIDKMFKVLGVVGLTGSILSMTRKVTTQDIIDNPDIYEDVRKTSRGLGIAGGICLSVGFIIGK